MGRAESCASLGVANSYEKSLTFISLKATPASPVPLAFSTQSRIGAGISRSYSDSLNFEGKPGYLRWVDRLPLSTIDDSAID